MGRKRNRERKQRRADAGIESISQTPATDKPKLGRRKMWAFRILALVVVPVLFFVTLEAGLRLLGFGYPTTALIERQIEGKQLCFRNPQFPWQFFPRQMARNFDQGLVFEKRKSPSTFRVFVLGASAAMGTPEPTFNFGRLLEAMLGVMYPDINFEVHNAAATAINSHVVLEIARDCAKYDPDLFIVYLGNNEVVGPFGPGTVFTSNPPNLPVIRTNIAVKSTRLGQLSDNLLGSASQTGQPAKQWGGMAMFLDKQVQSDSPALDAVYRNFEKNLQDICGVACRQDASVILCNVGTNLRDSPPFASLHRDDLSASEREKWESFYQQGVEFEEQEQLEQAIDRFLEAAKIDDTHADLQFRLGRNFWETSEFEKARFHYLSARQHDTLRFRADAQINDAIRRTAEGHSDQNVYFADSVAAFEANSPNKITGSELFYEHVHLKFKGNYILARTVLPLVQRLLPSTAQAQTPIPDESEVARRIAYTQFDEYTDLATMHRDYLPKPPFTNQLYHYQRMQKVQAQVEELRDGIDRDECLEQYDLAISENPDDWRLLSMQYRLMMAGGTSDTEATEQILRKMVSLCPTEEGYRLLGNTLYNQGSWNSGEDALNQALHINPVAGKVLFSLANISLKRHDRAAAIRHLRQAIDVGTAESVSVKTYRVLAQQYYKTGQKSEAIQTLNEAMEVYPDEQTTGTRVDLAAIFYLEGKPGEALKQLETAFDLNPQLANDEDTVSLYERIKGN